MQTAAILSPHLSDAATISVSSEVETLPGAHLRTGSAWQLYRATANTAQIIFDFGGMVSLDTGAIVGLNKTPTAAWRWKHAANVAGLASPTLILDWTVIDASAALDPRLYPNRRDVLRFDTVSCGALSIEIDDSDNADPVQAWRAMAGLLFQPVGNIDQELGRPIDSADVQEARFAGGRATGARGRARGMSFQWSALTRAEADTLQDIGMLRGNWGDVLFMLDPSNAARLQRDSVLGPFAPGYPDIADVALWPGDGDDQQMSRAAVRIIEGNT